ncbi:MAG: hypothetical protein CMF96_01535 [Candidatus Marinimicrobia bacterium]|nr:hypothetical protein [Candidatus Neomarinimicrobiota bacterium]|tara:strand:+ start:2808 stop:3293 length:486 start_codon:yes stop_codon:yes gene_type:complete
MSKVKNKFALIIWILILGLQTFIPAFKFNEIVIQADLILVLITFVSLQLGGEFAIIFGFVNGLIQDFSTQNSLLGILTLSKSVAVYGIHFIQKYDTIWAREVKMVYILSAYMLHNLIYYYFYLGANIPFLSAGIIVVLIQSIISFLIFIVFEKILFKSKLL